MKHVSKVIAAYEQGQVREREKKVLVKEAGNKSQRIRAKNERKKEVLTELLEKMFNYWCKIVGIRPQN